MVGNRKFREEYEKAKAILDTLPFSRFKICAERAHGFSFTFLSSDETCFCDVKVPVIYTNYPDSTITWTFTVNGEHEERYDRLYNGINCKDMNFTTQFQQIVIDMHTFGHHELPKEYKNIDPEFTDYYLKLIGPIKTKVDDMMFKHLEAEKQSEQELARWTDLFLEFLTKNYPPSRRKHPDEVLCIFHELGKHLSENFTTFLQERIMNQQQGKKINEDSPKPSSSKPKSPVAAAAAVTDAAVSETAKDGEHEKGDVSNPNQNS
ncbi:unnamed protein product [Rodentolepis nana]|uniref:Uncharacterized protein n=1 Tax=Rodentolepis nana TaxID=102285 RepID=A0A158QIY7_RODNA|nr:unnamed protein product [Rodentolepis nana]